LVIIFSFPKKLPVAIVIRGFERCLFFLLREDLGQMMMAADAAVDV